MKYFLLFCFPLWLLSQVHAQSPDIDKGARVILSTYEVDKTSSFTVYNPPFLAKAIYSDTVEAENIYPEQLMSSIISATSQEWVDYNTLGGSAKSEKKKQKYFDFVKSMDKDKNYYELRSKLQLTLEGKEYVIIKFYFHSDLLPEPKSGAYVMVKENGKWKITSTNYTSDIALMMMRFQEEKLKAILNAKLINDPLIDGVIQKVSDGQVISFTSLYNEFTSWYEGNNENYLNYFIDKNAW